MLRYYSFPDSKVAVTDALQEGSFREPPKCDIIGSCKGAFPCQSF
jgi:hypothetical protein